ncbi:MAG: hypothetical protein IKZ19_03545 [Clostridia bacterium]|nr:hypothetical protein [Clostridia bacterium]
MLRDFFTLYISLVCGHLGLDSLSNGGGKFKRIGAAVLVVVFGGFFLINELWLMIPLTKAAAAMEYPGLAIEISVLFAAVMGFLFAFYSIMRGVLFAGDLALLAPLPVKRSCIYHSKAAYAYTCTFFACAAVMLPAFGVYASVVGGGLGFWLRALAVIFLFPVMPMGAATVVAAPIALLGGKGRDASAFCKHAATVTVPIFDVFLAWLCVKSGNRGDLLGGFLSAHWAQFKAWSVPPLSWTSLSVCSGGMTSLITLVLFCAAAAAGIVIVSWILRTMFARRVSRVLMTPRDRAMK